jgi:transmembrane sensor
MLDMDERTPYDDELPWELILSAMQDELTKEQEQQLSEWLNASAANRETYDRISRLYQEGIEDYPLYSAAEEDKAWAHLQGRMTGKKVVPMKHLKHWAAAAAVLILVAGGAWWYLAGKRSVVAYATAAGEQRALSLPDGSTVLLGQQSQLELAQGYNKTNRTITLIGGKASFDVSPQKDRPFEVQMDAATVRDIGTSFTIDKTADSITVRVSSGRIAFIPKSDGKPREIAAGGSICLYTGPGHAGEIKKEDADSLRFEDVPLVTIIAGLEKRSGKRIILADTAAAQKRLTVNLEGEAFGNALEVICSSAGLKYTIREGTYVLERKDR